MLSMEYAFLLNQRGQILKVVFLKTRLCAYRTFLIQCRVILPFAGGFLARRGTLAPRRQKAGGVPQPFGEAESRS